MVRMQGKDEILACLKTFDGNPSLASLFESIASDVANKNMSPDEVVSRTALPLLSHYLGEGETIVVARALCERLKGLFDILIDGPLAGVCRARFEEIAARILEE